MSKIESEALVHVSHSRPQPDLEWNLLFSTTYGALYGAKVSLIYHTWYINHINIYHCWGNEWSSRLVWSMIIVIWT